MTTWLTDQPTDQLTKWLNDWLTDWPSAWLPDWYTDWLIDTLTDWLTVWLSDWLTGRLRKVKIKFWLTWAAGAIVNQSFFGLNVCQSILVHFICKNDDSLFISSLPKVVDLLKWIGICKTRTTAVRGPLAYWIWERERERLTSTKMNRNHFKEAFYFVFVFIFSTF